jgi:large subunit ribosomal protein L10
VPTLKKAATITQLEESIEASKGLIVTDYRGLTVEQITNLRRKLRPANAKYVVCKNTLLKRALAAKGKPTLDSILENPSAILFAEGDPVEATKILTAFIKELRKDLPQIKGGVLGNSEMNAKDVANLATLPPREQILANLLGTLQSPIANTVSVLGAVMSNLVGTIEAYHNQKAG